MKKKFLKWSALTLSALLSALGFGSCASHKATAPEKTYDPSVPPVVRPDTIAPPLPPKPVVYGPPPSEYRFQQPDPAFAN